MKKSLIALAVLAASGAAMAQSSSVTLFGVMDVGVGHSSGTNSVTGLTNGGLKTSRLGVRGVEDLGGGLKAGFWLEGGINADTGDGNKNGAYGGGLQFKRRSTISLMGDNWGEVRLGRDNTAHYNNLLAFDPFETTGSGGLMKNQVIGMDDRKSNTISYLLPSNLGGFYGQVQYIFGEKAGTATSTATPKPTDNGDGYGIRGGYANGPLNIGADYLKIKKNAVADNAAATALVQDVEAYGIGASYNFGVVKPFVMWNQEKLKATGALAEQKFQIWLVGLTAPVGPGVVRFSYNDVRNKSVNDSDSEQYSLGYVYNLSKRTALYGTYSHVSNDSKAKRGTGISGLSGVTINAGESVNAYEFGISHSF
ncbi:MAG: porin [Pseudomonadota bacterium]